MAVKKWEYETKAFTRTVPGNFTNLINDLGKEGWELVSVFSCKTNFSDDQVVWVVFKREIPEPPATPKSQYLLCDAGDGADPIPRRET